MLSIITIAECDTLKLAKLRKKILKSKNNKLKIRKNILSHQFNL